MRVAASVVLAAVLAAGPALAQSTAQPLSAIGQAAAQRGITTCLPAIDKLATGLAASYDIGVFLFNQVERPDEGLVSISMELSPSPSGGPVYVSASFVALAGACQVMVESTIAWQGSCAAVGLAYPNYRMAGHLLRDVGIFAAQGSERLFLMPSGATGCISVEKSVYF